MRISHTGTLLLLMVPQLFAASLNFESAVGQFLEHNYDLQIARHEIQKSRADLITAKERPNPLLLGSYEFMNINQNFNDKARGSNAQATMILTHPIETAGKRDRRIDLATHSITYTNLIYDRMVREHLNDLIDNYYSVLRHQSDLANAKANADAYNDIISIAKIKLTNGFLSPIDYQKISFQAIDYSREVENSRLLLAQERENLASLLALASSDITATEPIDSTDPLPDLEELLSKTAERPDCQAAKENLAVANAAWKLEKANGVPNITVGGEYASFGPTYEPLVGLNVSAPLPFYNRNEGEIEKSRIVTLQSAILYDKVLRMARAEITQSYTAVKLKETLYRTLRENFDSLKELKEKEEKKFALKGASVLELLDAQKSYRDYQKNMTRSAIDLRIAIARLSLTTAASPSGTKGH